MEKQTAPVLTCLKTPLAEAFARSIVQEPKPQGQAESPPLSAESAEPDILDRIAAHGVRADALRKESRRCLAEIAALRSENRWEDILSLFHPVEEKLPELEGSGLEARVRGEMAFVLGQAGRSEEAIALYRICVEIEPDNFHSHAGLAYTAYNSLYAARARQVTLHPAERKARIELAHHHFSAAQKLRPEGVTNFYRDGMLLKQIQGRKDKAEPLFEKAVRNWRAYSAEKKEERHQERKNYVKALYHLASCRLESGRAHEALDNLRECMQEDRSSDYVSIVHKYFALGKIHFELADYNEADQALRMAAAKASPTDDDFVFELMARTCLALKETDKAWEILTRVPMARRRPYVRWTEADILIERGDLEQACRTLRDAAERDRRGRHKALIRLARLEFSRGRYAESLQYAQQANKFFESNYQNPYHTALFWEAAALLRLRRIEEARRKVSELKTLQPSYPYLSKLSSMLNDIIAEDRNE